MTNFTEEQIKQALIRNNGWKVSGVSNVSVKKSSQEIKLPLTLLILGLFFCQNLSANNDPVPIFELKYTSMGQLDYVIDIYRDGKIHYHGDKVMTHGVLTQQVGVVGDRYTQITQAQLDEFTVYFLSLPFEVSKKYEMKRGNENWANIIDYKDVYANIHLNDPLFFTVVTKKLDKLINIRQWVCFLKDHPEYKDCLLRDDLPDNIESYFKVIIQTP
jgi:hypothetical protein